MATAYLPESCQSLGTDLSAYKNTSSACSISFSDSYSAVLPKDCSGLQISTECQVVFGDQTLTNPNGPQLSFSPDTLLLIFVLVRFLGINYVLSLVARSL